MDVTVGGTLTENVKGAVTEVYEDTMTQNVMKAVEVTYEDTKIESVTKKVTETYTEGQQTSITGQYDLDATGAMSIESDSTIKINQPSATQNATRKGDETEGTGDPVVVQLLSLVLLLLLSQLVHLPYSLVTMVQHLLRHQPFHQRLILTL